MRFYRGIAVPEASVADTIAEVRQNGLGFVEDRWRMLAHDLKPHLKRIWAQPHIARSDVLPNVKMPDWVCACTDQDSALYYACKHNITYNARTPLLIKFEADASDAIIDGRDLLYTLFQSGDPEQARPVVEQVFGSAVLPYIDRAWQIDSRDENLERISLCDLAVQDEEVIEAYARNTIPLKGRNAIVFRNAFFVRLLVAAERIVSVEMVATDSIVFPEPEVFLWDLLMKP